MALREFSGNARQTTLVGDITSSSTTFTVVDATGYPTGSTAPFVVVLNRGVATEEKILVASRNANTFTVSSRGFDSTTASAHLNGVQVEHVLDATSIREANTHANATGVAHGIDFSTVVRTADLAPYATDVDLAAHAADTTAVHGIADTAALVTTTQLTAHEADTTNVHGIVDTARLAKVDVNGKFVAPVVKETVAPAATDAATTQTLVNSLRTALINLGLVQ